MDKSSRVKELLAKVSSEDVEEILAKGKEMGFDDLTVEDIQAALGLSDETLDKVTGGMTVMS